MTSTTKPDHPRAWTRDGDRLFSTRLGLKDDRDIYVRRVRVATGELFVSTSADEHAMCLTPDGTELIYWQDEALMAIPIAGGKTRWIDRYESEKRGPPAWVLCAVAPDTLCLTCEKAGTNIVFRNLDLHTGIGEELFRLELEAGEAALTNAWAALSPDGGQIAVTEMYGRIRIVDVGSGEVRDMESSFERIQTVNWSQDGRWLYISGMLGGSRFWLRRISPDGKHSELLFASDSVWVHHPVPSPDGDLVAFYSVEPETDLYMMEDF